MIKIREEAKKLNPIDDLQFRKMAEHGEFCTEITRAFLEDPKLTLTEWTSQYVVTKTTAARSFLPQAT